LILKWGRYNVGERAGTMLVKNDNRVILAINLKNHIHQFMESPGHFF